MDSKLARPRLGCPRLLHWTVPQLLVLLLVHGPHLAPQALLLLLVGLMAMLLLVRQRPLVLHIAGRRMPLRSVRARPRQSCARHSPHTAQCYRLARRSGKESRQVPPPIERQTLPTYASKHASVRAHGPTSVLAHLSNSAFERHDSVLEFSPHMRQYSSLPLASCSKGEL